MVADAGMLCEANLDAIEDAGLEFIVGARKLPEVPYAISRMAAGTTPTPIRPTGMVFTQPVDHGPEGRPAATGRSSTSTGPTGPGAPCTASTSRSPRPRRPSPGRRAIKRNRFVHLTGGTKTVNRDLEAKARALAGLEGLRHQPRTPTAEYVIGAYHQLWQHRAQPSGCPNPTSAPGRSTTTNATRSTPTSPSCSPPSPSPTGSKHRTGWTIKKFVSTLRRYRHRQDQHRQPHLTAEDPLPDDVRQAWPPSTAKVRTSLAQVGS